jgi:phosphatidylinositol kinase/protein kinase (PI-3  family)
MFDAAAGLLSHAMIVGGRSPNKILLARASGRVWQLDFFPSVRLTAL